MWKVSKIHRGTEALREPVPAPVHAALLRWYTGHGSDTDEHAGVELVQQLKLRNRWLACDCLGETAPPPLLAPAYMTEVRTHYLRRLDRGRPSHIPTCPFFRDQVLRTAAPHRDEPAPRTQPDGFFAVLHPLGDRLAQRPDDDDPRSSGPSIPRLARLLWQLTELAGTNEIAAIGKRPAPSIKHEFTKLREAAQQLFIAPGVPLSKLLFTHPADLHNKRIYAQLRAAAATWPAGSQPQAFLLAFANDVVGREIRFTTGDPVLVASPVTKLPGNDTAGPYLVLVAIGDHAPARGFAPVRAYAQPIQDGRHFVPVDTTDQRALLSTLLKLQWTLRANRVTTYIRRPLFDVETDVGPRQPDFMLASCHATGQRRLHLIELKAARGATNDLQPERVYETPLDGVIRLDQAQLASCDRLVANLTSQLAPMSARI